MPTAASHLAVSHDTAQSPQGLSYADALAAVLDGAAPLAETVIALEDSLGYALAAAVQSRVALPPWDNAGMDGYAVRRADLAERDAPVALHVIGTIAAGADPGRLPEVTAMTAVRIMTGAPLPPGADAVVRVEDTETDGTRVRMTSLRDLVGRGNVRPRGEDVAAGALLFGDGVTIASAHLGVLASIGAARVRVHRRPRVTILSGGDELVLLDRFAEVEAGRRIVSSSSYALPALLRRAGAEVRTRPLLADTLDAVVRATQEALDDGCDLLITTGGISVGAHDFTRDALATLGATLGFWRARIRPGGPIGTGTVRGTRWLGLPGNPVSTMVTAALFAWPLVRRLGGHAGVHHVPLRVRATGSTETAAPLTYFVRVRLTRNADGVLDAHSTGAQGSNLLGVLADANALLVVPSEIDAVTPGMLLDAILLPDADWSSAAPVAL